MSAMHSNTNTSRKRAVQRWLLSLAATVAVFCTFGGNAAAVQTGSNCAPSSMVLCQYNTSYYVPSSYATSNCTNNFPPSACGKNIEGRGDTYIGKDQPVLQWLDNPTYNFENPPGCPPAQPTGHCHSAVVNAGTTINLRLGYRSGAGTGSGYKTITWANITSGLPDNTSALLGTSSFDGGSFGDCIKGYPSLNPTSQNSNFTWPSSPYSGNTTSYYSSCSPRDVSAQVIDQPVFDGDNIVYHDLHLNLRPNLSAATTVCLRVHVSIMKNHSGLPKHTQEDPLNADFQDVGTDDYQSLMGVMGAGRSSYPDTSNQEYQQPMCFRVLPVGGSVSTTPPELGVDVVACPKLEGWAYDPDDPSASLGIDVYKDAPYPAGTLVGNYTTDQFRSDVNNTKGITGNHGFSINLSSAALGAGVHNFYIYAIGKPGPPNTGKGPYAINSAGCPYHYQFSPSVSHSLSGGRDRPGTITFAANPGLSLSGGPSGGTPPSCILNTTGSYRIYRKNSAGVQVGPDIDSASATGCASNASLPIPLNTDLYSYEAGDQFCVQIGYNPGSGYVFNGPGALGYQGFPAPNPPYGPGPSVFSSGDCVTIYNEPIFKVLGSGVSAGGNFATTAAGTPQACTQRGVLAGWNNTATGSANNGSGAQFAAQSLSQVSDDQIYGFASAQYSSTIPPAGLPNGLTFANRYGVASTFSSHNESPRMGGAFGAASPGGGECLYEPKEPIGGAPTDIEGSATVGSPPLDNGAHTTQSAANLIVNGGTVTTGNNVAVNAKGNVYIAGNITYDPGGWNANTRNIPSFTLKANGNVYIASNVTQLDGLYVAKGNIYTCASGFAVMANTAQYANCHNQLVVNGSFVANQIKLMRTYGSLRNEGGTRALPCANSGLASMSNCAAEVFIFRPETYLSHQPVDQGPLQYKSITSLPPVL